jgi:hypothetical protein
MYPLKSRNCTCGIPAPVLQSYRLFVGTDTAQKRPGVICDFSYLSLRLHFGVTVECQHYLTGLHYSNMRFYLELWFFDYGALHVKSYVSLIMHHDSYV